MSDLFFKWAKFSLVAIVGCGFLAMAIYAFVMRDEIRAAQIEPPLINPPEEAVKRRPATPGGMEIPNQDKVVFDLLDGGDVPVTPVRQEDASGVLVVAQGALPSVTTVSGGEAGGMIEEHVAAPVPVVAVKETISVTEPVKAAVVEPVKEKPEVKIVEKVVPKVKEETKAANGSWGVQLAAVGSKADADKAVAKLKKNAALKGLSPRVVAAPDGKHYRVQFVGLKDRAAAGKVCAKLSPCFPVAAK